MSRFPGDPSKGMGIHPRPQKPAKGISERHPGGRTCQMALPAAVVMTLFYGIPRLLWDMRTGKKIV